MKIEDIDRAVELKEELSELNKQTILIKSIRENGCNGIELYSERNRFTFYGNKKYEVKFRQDTCLSLLSLMNNRINEIKKEIESL